MRKATAVFILVVCLSAPFTASSWSIKGGEAWSNRVGPGIHLVIGGNTCTDDYCNYEWDTNMLGSIAATGGFFYRIIPNLVVLGELHTGYINTDNFFFDNAAGFLFQATVAAEYHIPIIDWIDIYFGLGVGYAYLGLWGEWDMDYQVSTNRRWRKEEDYHEALHGINTEFRTGADCYPFKKLPSIGFGFLFRVGFTGWPGACVDGDNVNGKCGNPDDLEKEDLLYSDLDNLPFLIHIGIAAKYGF
jgi:hypothetical protein